MTIVRLRDAAAMTFGWDVLNRAIDKRRSSYADSKLNLQQMLPVLVGCFKRAIIYSCKNVCIR